MAAVMKAVRQSTAVYCSLLRPAVSVSNAAKHCFATRATSVHEQNEGKHQGELADIQKYWDQYAEVYTNYQSRVTSVIQHSVIINLQLANATSILEVGAGSGNSTELLLRELDSTNPSASQCKLVTSDFSPEMVKRLEAAVEKIKTKIDLLPNHTVLQVDVRQLPFEDGAFDRYFAGLCLHLTPEYETSLKESARVLTKGGIAGFSVWGREDRHTFVTLSKQIIEDVCGKDLPPQAAAIHSNFEMARDPKRFVQMIKDAGFSRVVYWYQQACAFTGLDTDRKSLMMPLGFVTVAEMLDSLPENIRKESREKVEQRLLERFARGGLDGKGEPLMFDTLCAVAVK